MTSAVYFSLFICCVQARRVGQPRAKPHARLLCFPCVLSRDIPIVVSSLLVVFCRHREAAKEALQQVFGVTSPFEGGRVGAPNQVFAQSGVLLLPLPLLLPCCGCCCAVAAPAVLWLPPRCGCCYGVALS